MRKNEWWTPQSANATTSVPCPYEDKRLMHRFWLVTLAVMVAVLSTHGNAATMVAADVNVLCRLVFNVRYGNLDSDVVRPLWS